MKITNVKMLPYDASSERAPIDQDAATPLPGCALGAWSGAPRL